MFMKNDIIRSIRLAVGSACITLSGIYFAKAIYHKGKHDAYVEVMDDLNGIRQVLESKSCSKTEEEES